LAFFALSLAIGAAAGQPQQGKILYYRDPMGKPEYSAEPKKDSMGMDYIPVYEGEDNSGQAPPPPAALPASAKGKILYYRNPMGLPDTSPVPKKDSMGMDYIPVYEGEAGDETGTVKIGLAKVQKLGVQSAPIERRTLGRTIRAVGTVQADERRLYIVNTKFEGWIDKLYINATGETVRRGQPLMKSTPPSSWSPSASTCWRGARCRTWPAPAPRSANRRGSSLRLRCNACRIGTSPPTR